MNQVSFNDIVKEVYSLLKHDPERQDYTVKTLAALLSKNETEVSRDAERYAGHYRLGKRQHRFHWQTVDYHRAAGLNLIREA